MCLFSMGQSTLTSKTTTTTVNCEMEFCKSKAGGESFYFLRQLNAIFPHSSSFSYQMFIDVASILPVL